MQESHSWRSVPSSLQMTVDWANSFRPPSPSTQIKVVGTGMLVVADDVVDVVVCGIVVVDDVVVGAEDGIMLQTTVNAKTPSIRNTSRRDIISNGFMVE